MRRLVIIAFWGIKFSISTCWGQVMNLNIGDSLPNMNLSKVTGYSSNSINLSAFRGKLVILDFGALYCHECLTSSLRFDTLQAKFKNDLQVLWVVSNSIEEVRQFKDSNKIGKVLKMPIIAEDTILNKYFRHIFTPHEVWIDRKGIIRAFTDEQSVDSNRIKEFLTNRSINWAMKQENRYDYSKDILNFNNDIDSVSRPQRISSTVFTSHLEGVQRRYLSEINRIDGCIHLHLINESILDLYTSVWKILDSDYIFCPSKILLEVKNPNRILYDSRRGYYLDWLKMNTYCYETTFSLEESSLMEERKILEDLNFYLHLNGRVQYRNLSCWVIYKIPGYKDDVFMDIKYKNTGLDKSELNKYYSISGLIYWLNQIPGRPPVINETHLSGSAINSQKFRIDNIESLSLLDLRRALNKYGLDVVLVRRRVKMLVFSDD